MAYTRIQCIAYQVPTVAKIFDNTAPTVHDLEMPDIQDDNSNNILPTEAQITNASNGNVINIYVNSGTPYTLSVPPTYNADETSDYQKWNSYVKIYLGKLIQYLEKNPATADPTLTLINDIITYLKYYTGWGDWTIPSGASDEDTVEIVPDEILPLLSAYELKDTDAGGANLAVLNDNANIDAKNRVIRFLNVLYKASQDRNINNNETTLKVFTAPEFYFRPKDPVTDSNIYRAYTYDVYKAIKEVLRETIKSGMILKHWLIVPGTIMWYMPANTTANNKTVTANTYFNSTVYIYNAPGGLLGLETAQTSHKLEKARASSIDGVPFYVGDSGSPAPAVLHKYYNDAKLGKHLFDIGTVKTGLEICLEHKAGAWGNNQSLGLLKHMVENKGKERRDLQLLIAGGMATNLPSIMLNDQRVFFRNDGLSYETVTVGAGTENRYVDAETNTYTDADNPTALTALEAANTISLNNDDHYELQSPTPQVNEQLIEVLPFNQQNIVIFPTQKIS